VATAFDVVVVPDFLCENARVFEGRTLFFLASWIENAGQSKHLPLHLACIGEPPPSVRWLAAEAKASITVHEPLRAVCGGTANKLRGLEVRGREAGLLLLDVDVLVLSDIGGLSQMGRCIAAAPACKARVPERYWQRIYAALGMDLPTERIQSVFGETAYPHLRHALSAEQKAELTSMVPKYNSGVVWAPWDCDLRALWEDHIRKIAALVDERDEVSKALLLSDEPALATAIQFLKCRGVPFSRLPDVFNTREPHIAMGALRVGDVKLFHAIRLCKKMSLDADAIHREPRAYRKMLLRRMLPDWYRDNGEQLQRGDVHLDLPAPAVEAYALGDMLQRLYVRHVAPAWRRTDSGTGTAHSHSSGDVESAWRNEPGQTDGPASREGPCSGAHIREAEMGSALRKQFEEQGFIGPLPIFTKEQCEEALSRTRAAQDPLVWFKGHAASCWGYYQLASSTGILDLVRSLLGDDILLWGASLVRTRPGDVHSWHTDVEQAVGTGRGATVWIGLKNTNQDTSLQLLSFSHRFGETVQQVAHRAAKRRTEVTTDDVREWAQRRDARSQIEKFDVSDGDALIFDGRVWHYSENCSPTKKRTALLLQYATPDAEIRIPAKDGYEWPFRFAQDRPPCIVMSGADRVGVNQTVSPPRPDQIWPCWVKTFDSLPEEQGPDGWRIFRIFKGRTICMKSLSSHISVLSEEAVPHPPHSHPEEELIVVLSGQVDIINVDDTPSGTESTERIGPGAFVYHAAGQKHTIRSVGPGPATYLVFKWKGKQGTDNGSALKSSVFRIKTGKAKVKRTGFKQKRILQSPTRYLSMLRSHVSILEPGAGYPSHRDPYDTAIVVLRGTVETLNHQVGPNGVIFYAANELHDMKNPGDSEASYLVFEFHGADTQSVSLGTSVP
jgi:quercetin dioxygenase-like cupin family protein